MCPDSHRCQEESVQDPWGNQQWRKQGHGYNLFGSHGSLRLELLDWQYLPRWPSKFRRLVLSLEGLVGLLAFLQRQIQKFNMEGIFTRSVSRVHQDIGVCDLSCCKQVLRTCLSILFRFGILFMRSFRLWWYPTSTKNCWIANPFGRAYAGVKAKFMFDGGGITQNWRFRNAVRVCLNLTFFASRHHMAILWESHGSWQTLRELVWAYLEQLWVPDCPYHGLEVTVVHRMTSISSVSRMVYKNNDHRTPAWQKTKMLNCGNFWIFLKWHKRTKCKIVLDLSSVRQVGNK